jgi:tetratricopeptide (TPR) repeat protein
MEKWGSFKSFNAATKISEVSMRFAYETVSKLLIILACLCLGPVSCSHDHYKMKRAKTLYRQGQQYVSQGKPEKAMRKFEDSIRMAELIDFKPGIAHNLNEIGLIYTFQKQYEKAREVFYRSLAIYQELEMQTEISKSMNNIAITYANERNYDKALQQWDRLVQWDKDRSNELGAALTLYNIATVYHNQLRQPEKAMENYKESLQLFKKLGKEDYVQMIEEILFEQ